MKEKEARRIVEYTIAPLIINCSLYSIAAGYWYSWLHTGPPPAPISRSQLEHHLLNLVQTHDVRPPVVELCRSRTFMRSHLLRLLQIPVIGQVDGYPGRPKVWRPIWDATELPGLPSLASCASGPIGAPGPALRWSLMAASARFERGVSPDPAPPRFRRCALLPRALGATPPCGDVCSRNRQRHGGGSRLLLQQFETR
jgi:hypothetical protein